MQISFKALVYCKKLVKKKPFNPCIVELKVISHFPNKYTYFFK